MTNKYKKRSRISEAKIRQIIKLFALDMLCFVHGFMSKAAIQRNRHSLFEYGRTSLPLFIFLVGFHNRGLAHFFKEL
jgi:hypothetical protein